MAKFLAESLLGIEVTRGRYEKSGEPMIVRRMADGDAHSLFIKFRKR